MKNKTKKIKVRFCPKCGGTKIIMKAGGKMGIQECIKCGFTCVIFPEKYIIIRDQMKNKKIKAIIFDVGGVLTKVNRKYVSGYLAEKLGLSLQYLYKKIEPEHNLLNRGKINKEIALKKISKKLGIDKKRIEEVWSRAFRKTHKKDILMINLTKKLKKNYRLAILSNQTIIQDKVMKKLNFYKLFNPIILSYKVGTRKPELKIYKITLKKLKLKPQECIFIDNMKKNLIPARKLGINTILFKNVKQLKRDLKKKGIVW